MKITKTEIAKIVKEEVKTFNEDVTLPANIKRFMDKLVDALKGKGLNRKRQIAILGGVINSLGIEPGQLMRMVKIAKKSELSRGLPEGKENLTEGEDFSKDQMKFAKPIFTAAAKKGKFKVKKMYMSFQPTAQISVYTYGKSQGSMTNIWGNTMTKKEAMIIKKAWEMADMDLRFADKSYKPKFAIGTDTHFITLYEAALYAGVKYDKKEYDRLFRSK